MTTEEERQKREYDVIIEVNTYLLSGMGPMNPIVIGLEITLFSLIQMKRSNEVYIIFRNVSFKGCIRLHYRQYTAQFIADTISTYIQIVLRENDMYLSDMDLSHYKEK